MGNIRTKETKTYQGNKMDILVYYLKCILLVLVFVFIWIHYEEQWLHLFNTHVVSYLNIPTSGNLTAITWISIILMGIQLYRNYQHKYRIANYQVIILIAVCVIYTKYRFSGLYLYSYFVKPFAYLDILIFAASSWIIMNIICYFMNLCTKESKESKAEFIPDQPIDKETDDILDYNIEASRLAEKLNNISLKKSWSIGITSPWGTGKTSFLNLVANAIDPKSFIVINYNPRNAKDVRSIQEDFFSTVCSALKPYNSCFSSMFKDYMEALQLFDHKNVISTILGLKGIADKDSAKEKISKALKLLPQKVVIIIEDFDRLLADEIIEIFKLIDGNASFPNVIFLTAYDKNHVAKMINDKYMGEESPFSDKFFSMEVVVPIRPYRKIHTYIVDEITKRIQLREEEKIAYLATLDGFSWILSKYLTTLRDAKRFINLFTNEFSPIKEEANFHDFFLLTIIKYKDPSLHRKLYNKTYLERDVHGPGRYVLTAKQQDNQENEIPYKDILERLFPNNIDNEQEIYRRIFSYNAFEIYFVTQTYDMLTKQEMQELLQKDFSLAEKQIKEWIELNKISDFIEFLSTRNILNFSNRNIFITYTKTIFHLSPKYQYTDIYLLIIQLLYKETANEIVQSYNFSDVTEYTIFIKKILQSPPPYYTGIIQKLIINCIDNEFNRHPIILNKEELLDISKKNLQNYISQEPIMNEQHMTMLYSCISDIVTGTRRVILDSGSCRKIKELINKSPGYYIENFVRPGAITNNPSFNTIACEPFWKSILGDSSSFKEFISQPGLDSIINIKRVRNFWRLYENNSYTPITIEGEWDVQKLIDNDLQELMYRLDELQKIKREFEEDKIDYSQTPRKQDDKVYLKRYEQLINRIKSNSLPIEFNQELLKSIQEEIKVLSKNNQLGSTGI